MAKSPPLTGSNSLVHLLHRASQYSEELFTTSMPDRELTARQLVVLEVVGSTLNPSQVLICEKTGIDRSTLAEIVRRLVKRGLLTRRRTREDARMYAVRLTDEGRSVLEKALPALRTVDKRISDSIPAAQRAAFAQALSSLCDESNRSARRQTAKLTVSQD